MFIQSQQRSVPRPDDITSSFSINHSRANLSILSRNGQLFVSEKAVFAQQIHKKKQKVRTSVLPFLYTTYIIRTGFGLVPFQPLTRKELAFPGKFLCSIIELEDPLFGDLPHIMRIFRSDKLPLAPSKMKNEICIFFKFFNEKQFQ